jgi:pyrroline-5-carboxylate reductase
MKRLGIIGFGNMGEAVAAGIRKLHPEIELGFAEQYPERAKLAREKYGCREFKGGVPELAAWAEYLFVAVKPQDAAAALKALGPAPGRRIISVVAGKPLEFFRIASGSSFVARFMPNLAATCGKAMVGVSFPEAPRGEEAWEGFRSDVLAVAKALGTALEIPEKLMPAITGISGSGIAFAFAFLHAMALGGVKAGLSYPNALNAALQVADGAVAVIRDTGINPAEFITRVTSPAGTTIAGIQALEESAFTAAVMAAVEAASARALELEA